MVEMAHKERILRIYEALQEKGYSFESAEAAYIPATTTTLTDEEHLFKMNRMLDMMEEDDDIIEIKEGVTND